MLLPTGGPEQGIKHFGWTTMGGRGAPGYQVRPFRVIADVRVVRLLFDVSVKVLVPSLCSVGGRSENSASIEGFFTAVVRVSTGTSGDQWTQLGRRLIAESSHGSTRAGLPRSRNSSVPSAERIFGRHQDRPLPTTLRLLEDGRDGTRLRPGLHMGNVYRACIAITRVLPNLNANRDAVCVAGKISRFIPRPGVSDFVITFLSWTRMPCLQRVEAALFMISSEVDLY